MIGNRLKGVREEKGIQAQWIAKKINVAPSTYSGYENNTSNPSLDIVCKLADVFDVSTDYLLGKVEDKDYKIAEKYKLPDELAKYVDYIEILKEYDLDDFSPKELKEIIEFAKKIKEK